MLRTTKINICGVWRGQVGDQIFVRMEEGKTKTWVAQWVRCQSQVTNIPSSSSTTVCGVKFPTMIFHLTYFRFSVPFHVICSANQMTGFYMKCKTGMKWVQPPNGLNNTKIQREARVRERNTWLQEKGKVRRGSYIQK